MKRLKYEANSIYNFSFIDLVPHLNRGIWISYMYFQSLFVYAYILVRVESFWYVDIVAPYTEDIRTIPQINNIEFWIDDKYHASSQFNWYWLLRLATHSSEHNVAQPTKSTLFPYLS